MEKEYFDVSSGIEKLSDIINKYTPLGPGLHRTDASKKKYIYDAVVEYNWESSALKNGYTSTLPRDFDRLCSAISAVWLEEQRRAYAQSLTPQDKSQSIFLKSQSSYGNLKSFREKSFENNFNGENSKIRCYNCGERGHISTDCPKPQNMTKICTMHYVKIQRRRRKFFSKFGNIMIKQMKIRTHLVSQG